jgi:8-oxo-dGTP diphosphatase
LQRGLQIAKTRRMATQPFAASVALLRKEDVLLIERAREPSIGKWTLPGGRLEAGETPEDCAARELREELGLAVYGLKPLGELRLGPQGMHHLAVFATQTFEGEIVPDPAEVRAWKWVKAHQIGQLNTTLDLNDVVARAFRLFDRS